MAGFVTAYCPLTALQLVVRRFVLDCRLKLVTLVGQDTITLVPLSVMNSGGGGNRLNTVP